MNNLRRQPTLDELLPGFADAHTAARPQRRGSLIGEISYAGDSLSSWARIEAKFQKFDAFVEGHVSHDFSTNASSTGATFGVSF